MSLTQSDDPRIFVKELGEGDDIVVLLHSSGLSGGQWRRTEGALTSAGNRVFLPDFIGSGRSPAVPDSEPFDVRDDVEAIAKLLARLPAKVHLVGHSYGGLVALLVAKDAPSRLRSLTLYDPVAFGCVQDDAEAQRELAHVSFGWRDASDDARAAWMRMFVDYWNGEGSWDRSKPELRAEFLRVGWVVHEGVRTLMSDRTKADAYVGITASTLIVTGEASPLAARRVVERLAAALPAARIARLEGAGHMGPITHGKAFDALLLDHVARAK